MKKFMTLMLAFAMTISALGALAEADGKITDLDVADLQHQGDADCEGNVSEGSS